jgi:hypothetical protein
MENMNETRENTAKTAVSLMGDVIYTIVFDISNELISAGIDAEKVLECANKVVNNYVEGGIKVRKKPAPRKTQPKASAKSTPIDLLKAAHKKMHSLTDNITWIEHPDSKDYCYTTSVKLVKGYPVKNIKTQKIEMVVNDEATVPLTVNDAKVALTMGFDVDYDHVQQ